MYYAPIVSQGEANFNFWSIFNALNENFYTAWLGVIATLALGLQVAVRSSNDKGRAYALSVLCGVLLGLVIFVWAVALITVIQPPNIKNFYNPLTIILLLVHSVIIITLGDAALHSSELADSRGVRRYYASKNKDSAENRKEVIDEICNAIGGRPIWKVCLGGIIFTLTPVAVAGFVALYLGKSVSEWTIFWFMFLALLYIVALFLIYAWFISRTRGGGDRIFPGEFNFLAGSVLLITYLILVTAPYEAKGYGLVSVSYFLAGFLYCPIIASLLLIFSWYRDFLIFVFEKILKVYMWHLKRKVRSLGQELENSGDNAAHPISNWVIFFSVIPIFSVAPLMFEVCKAQNMKNKIKNGGFSAERTLEKLKYAKYIIWVWLVLLVLFFVWFFFSR